jgi:hypothetical protein
MGTRERLGSSRRGDSAAVDRARPDRLYRRARGIAPRPMAAIFNTHSRATRCLPASPYSGLLAGWRSPTVHRGRRASESSLSAGTSRSLDRSHATVVSARRLRCLWVASGFSRRLPLFNVLPHGLRDATSRLQRDTPGDHPVATAAPKRSWSAACAPLRADDSRQPQTKLRAHGMGSQTGGNT